MNVAIYDKMASFCVLFTVTDDDMRDKMSSLAYAFQRHECIVINNEIYDKMVAVTCVCAIHFDECRNATNIAISFSM